MADENDWVGVEQARIAKRRDSLGVAPPKIETGADAKEGAWGLALSGGGIRSATFALGVLQALAKAPPAPQEKTEAEVCREAAEMAYTVLEDDPPGRVRSREAYDWRRRPLAWLRENGRYLTPTGAGDYLYAAGLAVRNWFWLHYVIGTALALLFALVAFLKSSLAVYQPSLVALFTERKEFDFFALHAWAIPDPSAWSLWWSPLWVLPLAVLLSWLLPSGIAFWLISGRGVHRRRHRGPAGGAVARARLGAEAVPGADRARDPGHAQPDVLLLAEPRRLGALARAHSERAVRRAGVAGAEARRRLGQGRQAAAARVAAAIRGGGRRRGAAARRGGDRVGDAGAVAAVGSRPLRDRQRRRARRAVSDQPAAGRARAAADADQRPVPRLHQPLHAAGVLQRAHHARLPRRLERRALRGRGRARVRQRRRAAPEGPDRARSTSIPRCSRRCT